MQDLDLVSLAMRVIRGASGLMWIIAIIGFGSAFGGKGRTAMSRSHDQTAFDRVASYMSEAVLPLFVLHQTVIVLVGFYLVRLPAGAGLKYLVIGMTSLVATLAIYETSVRRFRLTRFLFGMKPR